MAKRGRKPNPNKQKNYFGEEQENAVLDYLNTKDKELKNAIFKEKLEYAFYKMTESIIHRYKLYVPGETSGDTFNDALSFILTRIDKFDAEKGTKAYSFYGTVCRNYITGRLEKYTRERARNEVCEDIAITYGNNTNFSDEKDKDAKMAKELVTMLIEKIDTMLDTPTKYKLKVNEQKMGVALKLLLENWDEVISTDGSNKLNKNAILFWLREKTGFDTKGVRDNMKKYKNVFYELKKYMID